MWFWKDGKGNWHQSDFRPLGKFMIVWQMVNVNKRSRKISIGKRRFKVTQVLHYSDFRKLLSLVVPDPGVLK